MKSISLKPATLAATAATAYAFACLAGLSPAQAAAITGGTYDAQTDSVVLNVNYAGGCSEHNFTLEYGVCRESYPAQAEAKLIHETKDTCEANINTTTSISLADFGCRPAYLVIFGDGGTKTSIKVPIQGQPFPTLP